MAGEYGFILDNMNFSFSSVSTFENCNYAFKLTYIDAEERVNNFYGQYGSFIHLIMEKFFDGELDYFEMASYFEDNYDKQITIFPPAFQGQIYDTYKEKGKKFFENFSFDRNQYDTLIVEDSIYLAVDGYKAIAKPDLLLKDKTTGKHILIDFKTANVYKPNGTLDQKKMNGYMKQFLLYAWAIEQDRGIVVDEIHVWFINCNGKVEKASVDQQAMVENLEWFKNSLNNIVNEGNFEPNNTNKFFCQNLCSVSGKCEFKP